MKRVPITIHEPLAQLFFRTTREYTHTALLPKFGTSAFLILGVRACEILEIVPLFEDFMAELPFKMALNMRIIGVLLFQANEQTDQLVIGIQKLAETGKIGIMKDFLEVRSPIQGGQL